MASTTHLLLLRHAESEWNAEGRWQGWSDPPLSAAGRAHAARVAELIGAGFEACVSSDLRRAAETADIVAARLMLEPVVRDDGLREINVGRWSGLTHDQIEETFPGALAAWRSGTLERAEGGESRTEFEARILAALQRVTAAYDGGRVIVCTHGGVIRQLERHTHARDTARIGNLDGRWFAVNGRAVAAGDPARFADD